MEMEDKMSDGSGDGEVASEYSKDNDVNNDEYLRHSIQLTRTAMGEYIIPPGGKPLTVKAYHSPGPPDYWPKTDLTKRTAPQYSIAGRIKTAKFKFGPGPAAYNCTSDSLKNRKFTLRARGIGPRTTSEGAGPGKYNLNDTSGICPKRLTMKGNKKHIAAGPPDKLVAPVDTSGFHTPGPKYLPEPDYGDHGTKQTFGIKHPDILLSQQPGPGDYGATPLSKGPAYSVGQVLAGPNDKKDRTHMPDTFVNQIERKTELVKKRAPAPNAYDVRSTLGQPGAGPSLVGRHDVIAGQSI